MEEKTEDSINSSLKDTELLIKQNEVEELDEHNSSSNKKSCFQNFWYYLFCCCLCKGNKKLSRSFYISSWKNYLSINLTNETFILLTKVFAGEDVINQLQDLRLNPNFVSENNERDDLEFYIPQLCTFLLFGEHKEIEEFFVFLCKVCSASFFFAHRVHWFLSSMLNVEGKSEEIQNILKMICTLFKSESLSKTLTLEKFYITNSDTYIDFIKFNQLDFLYRPEATDLQSINTRSFGAIQERLFNNFKKGKDAISSFSENELKEILKKEDSENNTREAPKKLKPEEVFISLSHFDLGEQHDYLYSEQEEEETDDFMFTSKKSFKEDINYLSFESSINFFNHLCDISESMAKLPVDKQKEYLYRQLTKINKSLPCNVYLPFLKDSTRNYFICHIPLEGAKIFRTKTRAPIMLTFELMRLEEINEKLRTENTVDRLIKNDSSDDINIRNSNNFFKDSDIEVSKPVKLNQKKRLTLARSFVLSSPKESEIEQTEEEIKFKKILSKFRDVKIKGNRKFEESRTLPRNDFSAEYPNTISLDPRFNTRSNTLFAPNVVHQSILNMKEGDEIPDIKKNTTNESKIDIGELQQIFGQKIQDQEVEIKKNSLFGKMASHKIFKAIVKTNEDLRQEQFATQLINEFSQIFKISKTKCWLNTYEIISIGNNSGLIEMIPDSLSLDQLKKKSNNMSLNDFYINYFGKGNHQSKTYKNALKNYIKSLAGYSLVCYFLQIKDRHNGNILIDAEGHLIHIDFGFMLSNAPGKGLRFETAPFKLTKDMIYCLGGPNGNGFKKFKKYLIEGFLAVYKHRRKIIILVEMMFCGHGKDLPCFENEQAAIEGLKIRLCPEKGMNTKTISEIVDNLLGQSMNNWRTNFYDYFQYMTQGIFY